MQPLVLLRVILGVLFIPATLLGAAGRWNWWEAWAVTAVFFAYFLASGMYLVRHNKALLEKRLDTKLSPHAWDRVFTVVSGVFFLVEFVGCGLDERFGWSTVPPWARLVGLVVMTLSLVVVFLVTRENTFLARVVVLQEGQQVITTGPYAVVRHPMYAAFVWMMPAFALALDAPSMLPVAACILGTLVFRTVREDAFLHRGLQGYASYAQQTRYRLLPGVW
mgnify:CR=1 FL=1